MDPETESSNVEMAPLEADVARSRRSWRRLGLRLRAISPSSLIRFVLTVAALAAIVWMIQATWVALVPFFIGGAIAYILLPLVNRLDRYMPRVVAIIMAMGLAVGVVVLFFWLFVPVLVEQAVVVYSILPGLEEIQGYTDRINLYLSTLPEPIRERGTDLLGQIVSTARESLDLYGSDLAILVVNTVLGLVNTIGFILGFLVIPTWLLSVLQDQQRGKGALNRLLPSWIRADFWAILRILDRALGAFVRGQLLIGIVVAVLVYFGLELLVWVFDIPGNVRYQLLLALIAGLFQLIPSIGPFLGIIPAILIGLLVSTQFTIAIIILYIIVQIIVANFVSPEVERSIIDIHPAILLVAIVALSEFGFWWILLAAPITAIVRDLFQYVFGRISDPPRPAGVLPNETASSVRPSRGQSSAQPVSRRIPLTVRRRAELLASRGEE